MTLADLRWELSDFGWRSGWRRRLTARRSEFNSDLDSVDNFKLFVGVNVQVEHSLFLLQGNLVYRAVTTRRQR